MFTIKMALLIFALVVGIEPSMSCWYKVPLCLGAVLIEQILNAYTENERKGSSSNKPRYSHALFGCSHDYSWGFEEDTATRTTRLLGKVKYKCEECGLVWEGHAKDPNMPQHIKNSLQYARTH